MKTLTNFYVGKPHKLIKIAEFNGILDLNLGDEVLVSVTVKDSEENNVKEDYTGTYYVHRKFPYSLNITEFNEDNSFCVGYFLGKEEGINLCG